MKILKIFGIVVGIHVFALVLIFANPGCSSTSAPPPVPSDTIARSDPAPRITVPTSTPASETSGATGEPSSAAAASPSISFNPDAPAVASGADSGASGRFVPTRPGTPAAGTLVAEPVVDVTPATTYTVKSGDNLWTIAKKNNLTTAELAAANGIPTNTILRPGQKLLIPGKPAFPSAAATATPAGPSGKPASGTAAPPTPRSSGSAAGGYKHIVRPGETLGTIARQYGVKQSDIAVANNISDPAKIRADTELIIPGWDAPGAKSGKSGKKSAPASSPKTGDTKSSLPTEQPSPTVQPTPPSQPPPVPVIRIDDSPLTPAPKP